MQVFRRYSLIHPIYRFLSSTFVNVTPTTTQKELNEISKLMKTYNNSHIPIRTIALFEWMVNITNLKPDFHCYLHIIRACYELNNENLCLKIDKFIKNDHKLTSNDYYQLQIKLLYMYGKMKNIKLAEEIFYKIKNSSSSLDPILFGTIFKVYNMNGLAEKTIELYEKDKFPLDAISATCLLNAASHTKRIDIGEYVYKQVQRLKLLPNIRLSTAIMDMYCNCGLIHHAQKLFDELYPNVDHIAYSTLMKGYLSVKQPVQVLHLFKQFQSSSSIPADSVFYSNIIQAGYQLGLVHQSEDIHRSIPSNLIEKNLSLQHYLIDMHAHCLQLNEAKRLFNLLEKKDNYVLGNLIHGYAINGQGQKALQLYEQMKSQLKFNEYVHRMILLACAFTSGLVSQAKQIYKTIPEKYKTSEVAAIMVSILSRASLFDEVQSFINQYKPTSQDVFPLWSAFFMVCYHSGNIQYAKLIHSHIKTDPLLSLLFSDMTNSTVSKQIRNYFQQQSSDKCWTEIENNDKTGYVIHEFHDNDLSKYPSLTAELKSVNIHWESDENDLKQLYCGHHAIRLGIAQNFLSTSPLTSFQLTKLKPLCKICHEGIKQLSLIRQCDIILRDNIRVHHFHNGQCSCYDQF